MLSEPLLETDENTGRARNWCFRILQKNLIYMEIFFLNVVNTFKPHPSRFKKNHQNSASLIKTAESMICVQFHALERMKTLANRLSALHL